jgi:uncharacterized membrane protein YkvA (DUF1232 family)
MAKFLHLGAARNAKNAFHLFQNRRTLMYMLRETLAGRYKMSLYTSVAIILTILYVLFPFDFITDLLPIIGWADDGFIIYLLVKRLHKETQRFNRYKAMERKSDRDLLRYK